MPETIATSNCEGQHRHAVKLFQEGKYKEAACILDEVVKSNATSEIWNDWATAQLMCNQTSKSEQGYRKALTIDPANISAAGNLGVLLASTGRVLEALPLLEKSAAESSGKERVVLFGLIETCRRKAEGQSQMISNSVFGAEACREEQDETEKQCTCHQSPGNHAEAATPTPSTVLSKDCTSKAGVHFRGHIYGGSGYAEEAWVTALGLSNQGVPVQLVPIGHTRDTKGLLSEESRRKLEELQCRTVDPDRSIYLQFAGADAWDMETYGRWCIVRTMFETDRLPDGVADRCNAMDEVWVPSRFNLETYARAGVKENKLRFVPPGVDTHIFRPGVNPLQLPRKRGFNFLSIFDWHQRKGYDALLHAYLREFKPDEDVALVLKVSQFNDNLTDLQTEIVYFLEHIAGMRLENAPPIILVNGFIPQHEMPHLYATADCFVLPTRGEGYCRPFLEALACQTPVIATGWSGQTDFLNHENSYVLDYRLVPVPDDVDLEVYTGQWWSEPDVTHLRQLMRHVFSFREEAHRRAVQGRADIVRQYDWGVVIPQWMAEVRRLLG